MSLLFFPFLDQCLHEIGHRDTSNTAVSPTHANYFEFFKEASCSSNIDLFESNPSFWTCGAGDDASDELQSDLAGQGSCNEEVIISAPNVSSYSEEADDIYNTLFHHTDMSVEFEHLTDPVQQTQMTTLDPSMTILMFLAKRHYLS